MTAAVLVLSTTNCTPDKRIVLIQRPVCVAQAMLHHLQKRSSANKPDPICWNRQRSLTWCAITNTCQKRKKLMQCDDTKYCKEMWDQAALGQYQELEA